MPHRDSVPRTLPHFARIRGEKAETVLREFMALVSLLLMVWKEDTPLESLVFSSAIRHMSQ